MENKLELKNRIGIDLDDTVWKFHEKFFEFYNNKYNTNYTVDDLKEYNLQKFLKIDKEEMNQVFYDFEDEYKFLPELDNVVENILNLEKKYEIYFVTARPVFYEDLVNERLMKIFGKKYPVIFQYDKDIKKIKEKYEFCRDFGIEVMVDDGLHNLIECSENGMKCFLISYPWNQAENLNENIIRVNNWNEIINILGDKNEL